MSFHVLTAAGTRTNAVVRVPAAIRWPGVFPEGERLDEVVAYIDVLPTLRRVLTGDTGPAQLDGHDVFDLLRGGSGPKNRSLLLGDGINAYFR